MKKLLLIISVLSGSISGFSQDLKPVKIDNAATVSLPSDFTRRDTLGQQVFNANTEFGYTTVIRAENPARTKILKKEKDLRNVFKEYVNKVQKSALSGTIENDHDTVINNNLEARTFMLETDDENGHLFRKFLLVYTTPATYTFEYIYPADRQDYATGEAKQFFSTVKFASDINRADQYADLNSSSSGIPKGLIYGIIGGIIVLIVIWLVRRGNRTVYPS